MLKIGEFSRLSQISIHALRHYDNLGLLVPGYVDKYTSYRYYTLEQLSRAHRIMALKGIGLSLEQVSIMLNGELNIDELRGMFHLRQVEIEQHVREEQQRLAQVEFHLHMIEMEGNMPELDVVVKEIEAHKVLYQRIRVTGNEIDRVGAEIRKAYENKDFIPNSYPAGIMYGDEINPEDYEFAFAIPVGDNQGDFTLPTMGTLVVREMPAVTAATIVVQGHNPRQLIEKKVQLQRWAVENGFGLTEEMHVIQYKPPAITPYEEHVTELQLVVTTSE